MLERRVRHAVACYEAGAAPAILMSGGPTRFKEPEAAAMARLATDLGVPDAALHMEIRSTRTIENVIACRDAMAERDWTRALVVTDNFHMRRALDTFRAFDVEVEGAAVPVPLTPGVVWAYVREFFAGIVYARMVRAYTTGRVR